MDRVTNVLPGSAGPTAAIVVREPDTPQVESIQWVNSVVLLSQSGVNCRYLQIYGCDVSLLENISLNRCVDARISNCRIWLQGRSIVGGRINNCIVYCNSRQPLCRNCNAAVPSKQTKKGPRYGHYCSMECRLAYKGIPLRTNEPESQA